MEGRPTEDAEAIARARGGDVAAYEELVRRYQDVALRTAYLVCPETDADDAAQEGFVKASPRAAPVPGRRAVPAVAAPGGGQRGAQPAPLGGSPDRAGAAGRGRGRARGRSRRPSTAYLAAEERTALFAAINTLRDEDREVIGARFLLELSEAETAEALGIPRGTVKSRTSRALGRLREALAEANGVTRG